MDDTELVAAIGRIVVEAALLEYAVANLAAAIDGLQGEECAQRATETVQSPGRVKRLLGRLSEQRPELGWLMCHTEGLLNARHFVAHSVKQADAVADGEAALFILNPKQGESMITFAQARNNVRLIREGRERIEAETARVISGEVSPRGGYSGE